METTRLAPGTHVATFPHMGLSILRGALAGAFAILALGGCAANVEDVDTSDSSLTNSVCGLDPKDPDSPRIVLDKPFVDDKDAETRLTCLTTMLTAQHDHRGPFAMLYTRTTTKIREGLAKGRFYDRQYSEDLTTMFAELYRRAYVDYVDGKMDEVPDAWRIQFDTAKKSDEAQASGKKDNVLVLQHMVLGVNAHINRDLSHAVEIVGYQGKSADYRKKDYEVVRDILKENVDASLDTVIQKYAEGLGETPEFVRDLMGKVFYVWMVTGREKAWEDSKLLMKPWPVNALADREVNYTSRLMADAILAANGISPSLMAKLKQVEGSN